MAYFLKWNFSYGQTLAYIGELFLYTSTGEKKNVSKERLRLIAKCVKTMDKSYIELLSLITRFVGLTYYRIFKIR